MSEGSIRGAEADGGIGRAIDEFAGLLRETPVILQAAIIQRWNDLVHPRQPGVFAVGDVVEMAHPSGAGVQGIVRGLDERGFHQVWFPGLDPQKIRTDRLAHGRPMPFIETSEGTLTDPGLAERRLIAVSGALEAGVLTGRLRVNGHADQAAIGRGLAAWHGISGLALMNRLRDPIRDVAEQVRTSSVRVAAADTPRGMRPIARPPTAPSASGRPSPAISARPVPGRPR